MTKEQRTSDKSFLTEKELEFFILYVYSITCKPFYFYNLEEALFIVGGCTSVQAVKTVFSCCFLWCAFLYIFFNHIRIEALLLTMALPKNLIWRRVYTSSVKWKIDLQFEHGIFKAISFNLTRTPFLSRTAREADDKASFNKGEPIKLPEPKISLGFS